MPQLDPSWRGKLRLTEDFGANLRKTRVIYLEGDPALRFLISNEIRRSPLLDLVFAGPSLKSALDFSQGGTFDVALIETCHGEAISAGELASNLRRIEPNCGIVVYSQEASFRFLTDNYRDDRIGISVLQKSYPVDFDSLFNTLVRTAQGHSEIDGALVQETEAYNSPSKDLSIRDNSILMMLVGGKNTEYIAQRLNLAPVTIRQELSRIYRILVPIRTEGSHLRTEAVSAYLKMTKGAEPSKKFAGVPIISEVEDNSRPADFSLSK
jgi:DNA-binding NarL/FixJ family response regulator